MIKGSSDIREAWNMVCWRGYIDRKGMAALACVSSSISSIVRIAIPQQVASFLQALIEGLGAEAEVQKNSIYRIQASLLEEKEPSCKSIHTRIAQARLQIIGVLSTLKPVDIEGCVQRMSAISIPTYFSVSSVFRMAECNASGEHSLDYGGYPTWNYGINMVALMGVEYALEEARRFPEYLSEVARGIVTVNGDIERGISIVPMLASERSQRNALHLICMAIAEAGDIRGSLNLVKTIFADEDRDEFHIQTLARIAEMLAKSGKIDWALYVAYMIPPGFDTEVIINGCFRNILLNLAEHVELDRALDIVRHHFHERDLPLLYSHFIKKELKAGNMCRALDLLSLIPAGNWRVTALCDVSSHFVRVNGEVAQGLRLMSEVSEDFIYEVIVRDWVILGNEKVRAELLESRPDLRTYL